MNERVHGCRGGHYDMQRQRQANAAAEFRGDPLPHPYLPQLAPRSQAFCLLVSIFSNLLSYQLLRTHSLTHSLTTYYLLAGAVYGVDYFHAELERRSQRAALAAAPATVSQVHAP